MAFLVAAAHWSEEGYNEPGLNKAGTGAAISEVAAGACGGSSGTIASVGHWRVDKQNPTPTESNIQVQRNGQFPSGTKTSIGGVFVAKTLIAGLGNLLHPVPSEKSKAIARHKELTRAIHSGLSQSVGTWAIAGGQHDRHGRFQFYRVSGTFSS